LIPALPLPARGQQGAETKQRPQKEPDVVYVPTPQLVVEKMLELGGVRKGDVVYDLGCGDGRIVVTAAKKYGAKAIGIDIDPERIKEARAKVKEERVENLVTIKEGDIFQADFKDASVVMLYLLPELNVKLMPQLKKLKPGTRIVSHEFNMRGAKPARTQAVKDESGNEHTIYLWVVPWEEEK
jgi:predicted RNA methylase